MAHRTPSLFLPPLCCVLFHSRQQRRRRRRRFVGTRRLPVPTTWWLGLAHLEEAGEIGNLETLEQGTRNSSLFPIFSFFFFSSCCCCVVCFGFGWQSRQVLKRPSRRIRSVTRVTAMHHSADGTRFHFSLNASHSLCFDRTHLTFTRLWPHSLSRAGPTDANGHHLKRSSTPLGR